MHLASSDPAAALPPRRTRSPGRAALDRTHRLRRVRSRSRRSRRWLLHRLIANSVSGHRSATIALLCAIAAAGAPVDSFAGESERLPAAQLLDWCKDREAPAYAALERVQVSHPWFDVYSVRPGIFAIYEGK